MTVKTGDVTFADDQTITLGLGGTATETDDYTVTKELTLDAGESSVTTTVTAVQDTYDDDGETIEIKARHGAGTESEVQRITITDDDDLALTVELSDAAIAEAGGTSTVTVKTDDVTFADDQTITLVLGGTATESDDYTVTKELTLDAGESSVTTTVTAVQDTYDDDGETIEIKARHGVGTESEVQRITITDDDELALTVELSAAAIAEAGGTSTVTVKTDDVTFADDQTITLVLGGTATETDDYTVTKELTLDAGESSVTTTVTAVQDTYDDDGETIEIKARHGADTESAVQRITITDDDELALTVELSAAAIAEAGGTSTVTVKTDDVTFADDQTITLVLGGTATETDDYTVTKEPMLLWVPMTRIDSSSSSYVSCTAITVAVTELSPAPSVSDLDDTVKSSVSVAVLSDATMSVTVWASANVVSPVLTVIVDSPPSSSISSGATERLSTGSGSSSVIVNSMSAGAVGRAPDDSSPFTVTVLSGASTLLSFAVMVTAPLLSVAFAAKVRTLFVLSMKSPVPAGDTGSADTVTVNGSADPCSTVAVTVLEPPFSEIESGVNTNVTFGAASVRHTLTLSPTT